MALHLYHRPGLCAVCSEELIRGEGIGFIEGQRVHADCLPDEPEEPRENPTGSSAGAFLGGFGQKAA